VSVPVDTTLASMPVPVSDVAQLRSVLAARRQAGDRIGFVPTMGNLHPGHLSLVRRAAELTDLTVVSIFVNPLQFGDGEDFEDYPRTLEDDRLLLAASGAPVLLFTPSVAAMYPLGRDRAVRISVPSLGEQLCGAHRPGHFTGVATVVAKLLNLVQADLAVFGEKDLQQLRIIERLAADLHVPTRIVPGPIVREANGLAMSSRNRYLDADERAVAPVLYRELSRVATTAAADGDADLSALEAGAVARLRDAGMRPDYVSIRGSEDLTVPTAGDTELVVLGAAWLGSARLIDNVQFSRGG
jgi:pantoate--beta-alanine ligase